MRVWVFDRNKIFLFWIRCFFITFDIDFVDFVLYQFWINFSLFFIHIDFVSFVWRLFTFRLAHTEYATVFLLFCVRYDVFWKRFAKNALPLLLSIYFIFSPSNVGHSNETINSSCAIDLTVIAFEIYALYHVDCVMDSLKSNWNILIRQNEKLNGRKIIRNITRGRIVRT